MTRINEKHRAFIRSLPCAACGNQPSECAHVRASTWGDVVVPLDERGGTGIKPADAWTLPMCRNHHALQHQMGERPFWNARGINPLELARQLWANTGKAVAANGILERHRNGATLL